MQMEVKKDVREIELEPGEPAVEFDYRQNKILADGRWVAVASYEPGAAVAFLSTAVSRSLMGHVCRALDAHDGEPAPRREIHVPGQPVRYAEVVVRYDGE